MVSRQVRASNVWSAPSRRVVSLPAGVITAVSEQEAATSGRWAPFAHLHGSLADAYRAVLAELVRAKESFVVHVRPDDVQHAVPGHDAAALLEALVGWGNLRSDPDTGRVTTVEDFHRARRLYALTPQGEAVERALRTYDDQLGRRAELQAVALAEIADTVRALALLDPADAARADAALTGLVGRFEGLADNAQAFMASLRRSTELTDPDTDSDAFVAYKDRLLAYLRRFTGELTVRGPEIARLLGALEPAQVDALLLAAATHRAADAAPDEQVDAVAEGLERWRQRWSGLVGWFTGDHATGTSQQQLLRRAARTAVTELLDAVARLGERRSGRSDRAADWTRLAVWFAEADGDGCARLWRSAFGLAPARHLAVDGATLDLHAERRVPPSASWAQAPPVVIIPRLRATGQSARRGPPAAIRSRDDARRHLAALAAAERAQAEQVRRRLATGRPTRLSELDDLDPHTFATFLALLGDALAGRSPRHPDAEVAATTRDGALEVRLRPTRDGRLAEVRTPHGTLVGPDHVLTVVDLTAPAVVGQERAA